MEKKILLSNGQKIAAFSAGFHGGIVYLFKRDHRNTIDFYSYNLTLSTKLNQNETNHNTRSQFTQYQPNWPWLYGHV